MAYLIGLKEIFKSYITKLSIFIILFVHLFQIVTIPIFPDLPHRAMGYRYICWSWIAWAVLYTSALSNKSKLSLMLNRLLIVGIIIQLYILITVTGEVA